MIIIAKGKYKDWLTDDGLLKIKGWAREGLKDEQIADQMHIGTTTFYRWQNEHQEIREALKEGKKPLCVKIEDAFYSRCDWTEVEDVKEEIFRDSTGRETRKKTIMKRKMPPDTAVLIFALKNLRPDKWRDKPVANIDNTNEAAAFDKLLDVIGGKNED